MKCTHYIYFMDSPGLCATAPRIISTKELLLIHPHPQWALAIWILNDLNHCHHYGLAAKKIQLIGLEEDLSGNHT